MTGAWVLEVAGVAGPARSNNCANADEDEEVVDNKVSMLIANSPSRLYWMSKIN